MTPTNPGTYLYIDQPGAPAQRLDVVRDGDVLCARFEDDGDVELVPVTDMAGQWETMR